MSTFYAYYTGHGGCDYTLGCNRDLQRLDATNKRSAELEIQEAYSHMGEYGIDKVQLLEVKSTEEIDLTAIDKKMGEERRHKEMKRVEAEERALYEKLRIKFEQ